MTVILALPAYNEEQGLPKLLQSFSGEMKKAGIGAKAVIVDDGSIDGTGRVIEEWSSRLPIDLVKHPENRGLGETIRDALRRASEVAEADDVIVTMDADNTHSPALIPEMLRLINAGNDKGGNDLVIASRYRKGSRVIGLAWHRHLMSYGARILFQIVFPIPNVRDYTCGFRAYRADALRKAFAIYGDGFVTERSFACMAEILLRLRKLSLRTAEVPMVLRYDRKEGVSKMKVARTVSRTLRLMVRIRSSS
jgi:dolichol-phosphate mannosyltransferase